MNYFPPHIHIYFTIKWKYDILWVLKTTTLPTNFNRKTTKILLLMFKPSREEPRSSYSGIMLNTKKCRFYMWNFNSTLFWTLKIHTEKYREFQARFSLFFIFENIYYLNSKSKRCLEEQCCKCIEDKNFSKKEFWRGLNLIW